MLRLLWRIRANIIDWRSAIIIFFSHIESPASPGEIVIEAENSSASLIQKLTGCAPDYVVPVKLTSETGIATSPLVAMQIKRLTVERVYRVVAKCVS
jgi:hypothetical protein